METAAAVRSHRQGPRHESRTRRVSVIWTLLFLNALIPAPGGILPIPHRVFQLMTQGALVVALVLALTINPRMRVRPNWFLGLYTLLAITSLMMSVRLVGLGTAYRSFRFIAFLTVLWLLTPWWGRRDLLVLRSQLRCLLLYLGSVVLVLAISPGHAMIDGRLVGALWPTPAPQVAHYAALVVGLTTLLWLCRLIPRGRALMLAVPAIFVLVLTHTRTALTAMTVGLLVAGFSLFLSRRRVRKTFTTALIVLVVIGIPASPLLANWLARGENTQQIQNLTGRTRAWSAVLSTHRPATNIVFGNGISNDSVVNASNPLRDGIAIDSSWITIWQDQGIVGEVLVIAMLVLLLLVAISRARGPTRAMALFLIVYCLIAGIDESGLGGASQYLLDLTVAASLLSFPSAKGTDLTFSLGGHAVDEPALGRPA